MLDVGQSFCLEGETAFCFFFLDDVDPDAVDSTEKNETQRSAERWCNVVIASPHYWFHM